jgi:hypothetical protein
VSQADSRAASTVHALWPVSLLERQFAEASRVNPTLIALFLQHRARHPEGERGGGFYTSGEDLLQRYATPELRSVFQFISDSVFSLAQSLNARIWSRMPAGKAEMHVVGAWFQMQNGGGFHDIHNHGNCSWSGVYYLQIDPLGERERHPTLGAINGVTRFYGPYLDWLGGAYVDLSNAYLQGSHFDVAPEEGKLVIFPAFLKHQAMPYEGRKDRMVLSFNIQVHGERGDRALDFSFA